MLTLPRIRGGISGGLQIINILHYSSPHTRGYFRVRDSRPRDQPLFPAYAGVFPLRLTPPGVLPPLPRIRGGISLVNPILDTLPTSSPHTRGYFLSMGTRGFRRGLFPAHAGVFPCLCPTPGNYPPLPRTRGGISSVEKEWVEGKRSSPHTRGYFHSKVTLTTPATLFPAHAGVFPLGIAQILITHTLPRTRGGISEISKINGGLSVSSPHTRGYFRNRRHRIHHRHLFPAHAGVFPVADSIDKLMHALPRTRGGISRARWLGKCVLISSPHTRGYFRRCPRFYPRLSLFPAHAGVFPSTRRRNSPKVPLPRTRGGISSGRHVLLVEVDSSPHTRGYFPQSALTEGDSISSLSKEGIRAYFRT